MPPAGSSRPEQGGPLRRALQALDRVQRRRPGIAVPVAVVRKFVDDGASGLAGLIAYYAFFSLFPLLLVFVSVLGFVLEDDPSLQQDVLDSTLARIPVVGAQLDDEIQPLTGSTVALVVGLVGALWAGLGVTVALQRAFNGIWDVPRIARPSALRVRVRGVLALVVLGIALVAATVGTGIAVAGRLGPAAGQVGGLVVALTANAAIYVAAFALLTARPVHVRELLPGAALAAAGSLLLQAAGSWYVELTITRGSDTYGAFALVIGLLSWFWLLAHLVLTAAELNVVLRRRLWPRSLSGDLLPADRAALTRSAEAAQRDERQEILVRFREEG